MSTMVKGPQFGQQGSQNPLTGGFSGAQRVMNAHGRHLDAALARRTFWAANQTATTWSVALNTTHTGFVLSNPRASGVNLVPLFAGFALSVAPAGIASIGLFAGNSADGIVTHTTPLVEYPTMLDSDQGTGVGNADAAATLVGTPRWILPLMSGFTAGALPSTSPNLLPLEGVFVVPPGAYIGLGALTAAVGFGAMVWEEIPIIS